MPSQLQFHACDRLGMYCLQQHYRVNGETGYSLNSGAETVTKHSYSNVPADIAAADHRLFNRIPQMASM